MKGEVNLNMILRIFWDFFETCILPLFFLPHFFFKSGKCVDFGEDLLGFTKGTRKMAAQKWMRFIHLAVKTAYHFWSNKSDRGWPSWQSFSYPNNVLFRSSLGRCHMKFPRISVGEIYENHFPRAFAHHLEGRKRSWMKVWISFLVARKASRSESGMIKGALAAVSKKTEVPWKLSYLECLIRGPLKQ